MPTLAEQAAQRPEPIKAPARPNKDVEQLVQEIELAASTLNKRLRYSINRELNQVVVKVIDRNTDKVIKELPPEALQRLHVRIREAIGLLIDEEI
jgi:flagellar protein FlaG